MAAANKAIPSMIKHYCFWSHKVQTWLQLQPTAFNIEDEICVSTVVDNAKTLYRQTFHQAGHSVDRYQQM